jgi:DNA-binding SARP family transcriptional activator
MFSGNVEGSFAEIEAAWPLLHSPLVTPLNKGSLYLASMNLLANTGDHAAYRYHYERFRSLMGGDVFDRSVMAAFSNQWAIDLALVRGDFQECRERLAQAQTADFAGAGLHLRCQTMQYAALVAALTGNRAEALSAAEESLRLRGEVGSPIFIANNCGLVGGAYVHLGEVGKALPILKQGLEHSRAIGDFYARATLHAYRAWLYLEAGESALARQDIADLLDCLHRYGYPHFYGWHPQLMQRLLSAAAREGIRADFARQLAARRLDLAILPGGVTIPLLRIRTLGDLEISIGDRSVLRGSELTPAQRQLLAVLLASTGLQRSQEEIAALLWPDSPEEKARKSFDALLIRLRRTVHEASGGEIDSRRYLPLRKGILALEHCRIDAQEFREGVSKALRHLRKGESWQADGAFRSAFSLREGEFLAGMPLPEPAETFRQDLATLYLECACRWSRLLSSDGRHEEARQVAEAALRHDPIHEDLVRSFYEAHIAQGQPAKARKVLDDYAAALRAEQFAEDEIEEILEAFWTKSV